MKTRILVVEDESTIRQSIVEFLSIQGYEVFDTDDGYEGIEMAQQHQPNVIISDINMPQMDGYNVLTAIQQNPKLATIPFIFITALADRNDRRLGMELGADDYIVKPFTFDELMQAIKTRLRKHAETTSYYFQEIQRTYEFVEEIL